MATEAAVDPSHGPVTSKPVYVVQQGALPNFEPIDWGRLLRTVWRRRWWIVLLTVFSTMLGVSYALLATPYYRAEAVLMPREGNAGGLSSQLSRFAGLADLAGINVAASAKQEPMGILRSKGFARRFIEANGLVDTLSAAADSPFAVFGRGSARKPSTGEIVDHFTRTVLMVTEDKKSGLVVIAVTWKDPQVAANWSNGLVKQINEEVRQRALVESEANIRYLSHMLAQTTLVPMQQSLSRVLEAEMQKVMLAKGTREYAFRVIDAAEPPVHRERPRRTAITVISMFTGLLLGCLLALAFDPLSRLAASLRDE